MPGGSDYNRQRPPRRKSWQNSDEPDAVDSSFVDEAESYSSGFNRNVRMPGQTDEQDRDRSNQSVRGQRPDMRKARPPAKGRLPRRFEDDDDEDDGPSSAGQSGKKAKRKKLFKLLGAEALCLGIIFGLIAAFNWMAGDFSGDYMGRSRELGQIRLSLGRLEASQVKAGMKDEMEVEMEYGRHGLLGLRPGEHVGVPVGDQSFTLKMVSNAKIRRAFSKPWLATFTGHIEDGKISGTIADTNGAYKISLEKNLMTSLFRQTQGHIPTVPSVPLPSLFDENAKAPRNNDFANGGYPRAKIDTATARPAQQAQPTQPNK